MGGYKNRILEVDLSIGRMDVSDVSEDDKKRFIGGSGVSAKLFLDRFDIQSNALSPGNPLMIMNGPITGKNLPGTSRFVVCGKSVLTGIWGESACGGGTSKSLRYTKTLFDGTQMPEIIVLPKAHEPGLSVSLFLFDKGCSAKAQASHH